MTSSKDEAHERSLELEVREPSLMDKYGPATWSSERLINSLLGFLPILTWLPDYPKNLKSWLIADMTAGFTVGLMVVPQGMAYALVAGLPAVYGLYTAWIPLLLTPFLTSSKEITVGPTAVMSLLVPSALAGKAAAQSSQYIQLANTLTLMTGLILLACSVLNLGFLIENVISRPVLSGFVNAAAFLIIFGQVKNFLGASSKMVTVNTIQDFFSNMINYGNTTNGWCVLMSSVCILILLSPKKFPKLKMVPLPLLVLIFSTLIVYLGGLDQKASIPVIKDIPSGVPTPQSFSIDGQFFRDNIISSLTLSIIGYIEAISVTKRFAALNNYSIRAPQEMINLSVCNLIASVFRSYPVTGSLSRTAVNYHTGSKTPANSWFASIVILIAMIVFAKMFYYTPNAVLAAVVIVAALGLFEFEDVVFLWHYDRLDFLQWVFTFVMALTLGVENGVVLGVLTSLFQVIYRSAKPRCVVVGKLPTVPNAFRDVNRYPSAVTFPGILIMRFDARLAFYNVTHFSNCLEKYESRLEGLHTVIIDCEGINEVDSTALHQLKVVIASHSDKGVRLLWAHVKQGLRDALEHCHLSEDMGYFWLTVQEAVDYATKNVPSRTDKHILALDDDSQKHTDKQGTSSSSKSEETPTGSDGTEMQPVNGALRL